MQGNMKEHLFITFILSPLFSSSYVQMWEVDHKEIWVSKMLSNCGIGELLRIPWTARRSNQSILKEINSKYSLEGLMLKLKLQCFGHLMPRADPLEKTLMLGNGKNRRQGGEEDNRGWDGGMASLTQWTLLWAISRRYWKTGKPGMLQFMGLQRNGHNLETEQYFK